MTNKEIIDKAVVKVAELEFHNIHIDRSFEKGYRQALKDVIIELRTLQDE